MHCTCFLVYVVQYRGGTNPRGTLSTLQESQISGMSNDMPIFSYDFFAPIGEFGQVRTSFLLVLLY